jgi:integrase
MPTDKIPYLLFERGRYYYQRKVPLGFQDVIGTKKWREPAGADYLSAVDKVRALSKEHTALLARVKNPDERRDHKTKTRRRQEQELGVKNDIEDEVYRKWLKANDMEDPGFFGEDPISIELNAEIHARPWVSAASFLEALESSRVVKPNVPSLRRFIDYIDCSETIGSSVRLTFPPFPEYKAELATASDKVKATIRLSPRLPLPMDDDEFHDGLVAILNIHFGPTITPPTDPEDRDEFDLAKQRLERKIARVARSPDTITKVAERYYRFAQVRDKTKDKYRRTINRLTAEVGDLPIQHLTAATLRQYRDKLTTNKSLPSTIRADFTPVIGLLGYAVDEGLIDLSPMAGVKLQKEKRAIEEMKWLPFEPDEMVRILAAVEDIWGQPTLGLSDARRQALQMAIRVLAYTSMRPAEFMALRPEADDHCIRVEGGKTKSAWRVIPLHPKIADFPEWLKAGGLEVFANGETGEAQSDPVTPVRHNFTRLIRKKMAPPINHPKKALYSLRSTFQNALRRAGAPIAVRRAILGHVESGAMRHYDDGPEFEELKRWIELADPTEAYRAGSEK